MEKKIDSLNLKVTQLEQKIDEIKSLNKIYSDALYEIVRMGRNSEPKVNHQIRKRYAGFADTVLYKKEVPSKIDFNSIENFKDDV